MKEVTFFSARTRIGTRGAVRVAFGTVSTTEYRSPNGDARAGKSRAKVLVDPPAAPTGNRYRLCSGWRNASTPVARAFPFAPLHGPF